MSSLRLYIQCRKDDDDNDNDDNDDNDDVYNDSSFPRSVPGVSNVSIKTAAVSGLISAACSVTASQLEPGNRVSSFIHLGLLW